MNVKELITELEKVENQEKEVYIYYGSEPIAITSIDNSISDRLDINIDLNMPIKYLSTNLESDENLDLTGVYRLEVDKTRNGNLNLVAIGTENKIVCEFQNNEV